MKNRQTRFAIVASFSAALLFAGCSRGHDTTTSQSGGTQVTSQDDANAVDSCGLHAIQWYGATAERFKELSDETKAYDDAHDGYNPTDECSRELHYRVARAADMRTSFSAGTGKAPHGI